MAESKVSQLEAQKEFLRQNLDLVKKERDNALASLKEAELSAAKYEREAQKKEEEENKQRREAGYYLLTELSEFKAENSLLREKLDTVKKERDNALASLKEAELSALKKDHKAQSTEEKANKQRREEGYSLLTQLSNTNAENLILRDNLDTANNERNNALKSLKEEVSKVSELGIQLAVTKVELEAFTHDKLSLEKNANAVKKERDNALIALKEEESKVSEMDIRFAVVKVELKALTHENLALEKKLDAAKMELGDALKLLDDLKIQLSSTASNLALEELRSRLNQKGNEERNAHLYQMLAMTNEHAQMEVPLNELPKMPLQNEDSMTAGERDKLTAKISSLKEKIRAGKEASEKAKASLEEKLMEGRGERRRMHELIQELRGNIRVFARIRPFLLDDNVNEDAEPCVVPTSETSLKIMRNNECKTAELFSVDRVFPQSASQGQVFTEVSEFVQSALDGYNVCLFSYGQTGSGKTHTMQGSSYVGQMRGIIPRAIEQVSEYKAQLESDGWQYTMQVSFLEIYNETIRDLLRENEIDEHKHEVKASKDGNERYVSGITMTTLEPSDVEAVKAVMQQAEKYRSVAYTNMNSTSSRSHSVFTLHMSALHLKNHQSLRGALNLVDLAGSERLNRSKNTGDRAKETMAINKSLSALTHVFSAIAKKDSHVPFRDSTLTKLLQPSFSGAGKTLMMVALSPTGMSSEETLCSLRFASNVRQCKLGKAERSLKYNKSSSVETGKSVEKKQVTKKSNRNMIVARNIQVKNKSRYSSKQGTAENSGERGQIITKKSTRNAKPVWR